MISRDYIMEEAERLTKLIAAVVFQKATDEAQAVEEYTVSQDVILLGDLRSLIHAGQINEAENLLFERLYEDPSVQNFSVAGIFFRDLSKLEDKELRQANFLRQEIMEGILSVERFAEYRGRRVNTGDASANCTRENAIKNGQNP